MKNNYSIAERNRIVEEHLFCIDQVLRKNRTLIRAAHLEDDDMYQDLAICLILSVNTYDPTQGPLRKYLFNQLQKELHNRKEIRRLVEAIPAVVVGGAL